MKIKRIKEEYDAKMRTKCYTKYQAIFSVIVLTPLIRFMGGIAGTRTRPKYKWWELKV